MRILLIILVSSAMLCTGCLNITEKLKLNKDGSGTYSMEIDMSEMLSGGLLEMLGEGAEAELGDLGALLSDTVNIDSVSYFSEKPDSIQDLWMYPEITKRAKEYIMVNGAQKVMRYTFELPFKKLSDIADFMSDLQASGNTDALGGMGSPGMSTSLYSWQGKELKRTYNTDMQGMMEEAGLGEDEMVFVELFFGTARYRTEFTFPGKVKKSTLQDAEISGKMLVTDYPLTDIINGDVDLDGTVKFKKK